MIGLLPFALALAAGQAPAAPATPTLEQHLRPMGFLVGRCWTGSVAPGAEDTHCFKAMYGGRFIRDTHVVRTARGSTYEGETIYGWDAEAGRVTWTYWASDGGIARGTMAPGDGFLDFGTSTNRGPNGTSVTITTTWVPGEGGYETRWSSPTAAFNRTTRYRADTAAVTIRSEPGEGGTTSLIHETVLNVSPQRLYGLFATVDGWRRWAVPNAWADPADPDVMETSYDRAAAIGAPQNIRQRFLLRVPSRLVAWRTIRTPRGFPHAEAFMRTTQMIELIPEGDGTRIRLTGQGYPAGPEGEALLAFFREGNRTTLENLRRVVALQPN